MKTLSALLLLALIFKPALSNANETNCIEKVKEVICLVDAMEDHLSASQRPCLETPQEYTNYIVSVLEKLPEETLPILCHVKRIFIEKEFYATGYASSFIERVPEQDRDNMLAYRDAGWVIGLSEQKVFKENWTLNQFLAHKDQTLFGRDLFDPVPNTFPYLQISHASISERELFLYDVLVHEIGHLMDFANEINSYTFKHCLGENGEWIEGCMPSVYGPFASITWSANLKIRSDAKFFDRALCFYNSCDHMPDWRPIEIERADEFFEELASHDYFISTYAPASPAEDFAETFTYYFYLQEDQVNASLYFPSKGLHRSILEPLKRSESRLPLVSKLKLIENILGSNLNYKTKNDSVFWRPKNFKPLFTDHILVPSCKYY